MALFTQWFSAAKVRTSAVSIGFLMLRAQVRVRNAVHFFLMPTATCFFFLMMQKVPKYCKQVQRREPAREEGDRRHSDRCKTFRSLWHAALVAVIYRMAQSGGRRVTFPFRDGALIQTFLFSSSFSISLADPGGREGRQTGPKSADGLAKSHFGRHLSELIWY